MSKLYHKFVNQSTTNILDLKKRVSITFCVMNTRHSGIIRDLSLLLQRVVDVVGFFFVSVFAEGIYDLAVVPLSVLNVLGRAHYGYIELSSSGADVIPVYKINVSEFSAVKHAVLYGHTLASAEEYGAQMSVRVHAREVARLVHVASELQMYGTGMAVLMLLFKVRYHFSHDIEQIVLQIFDIEAVYIVAALLYHDGARRMMRRDSYRSVFYAGRFDYLYDLF